MVSGARVEYIPWYPELGPDCPTLGPGTLYQEERSPRYTALSPEGIEGKEKKGEEKERRKDRKG